MIVNWVHLLRDLHKLRVGIKEGTEEAATVTAFVEQVRDVYDRARAYQDRCRSHDPHDRFNCGVFDRKRRRKAFEEDLPLGNQGMPYLGRVVPVMQGGSDKSRQSAGGPDGRDFQALKDLS